MPYKTGIRLLGVARNPANGFPARLLGSACIAGLIVALAAPDELDVIEAQIAAVYLTLLIGSNKAFNAKPICGHRILGAIATFTGVGLLPATIIHVAIAQIEPGQNAHVETLMDYGIVTVMAAFLTSWFSWIPVNIWQTCEEKQNYPEAGTTPN